MNNTRRLYNIICALCIVLASGGASAESLPLWELGFGVAGLGLADYRGSKEYHYRALPVPYLVIRSEHLRADRDGLRGLFFSSDRVELNFSAAASLATDTDDNKLREGMPELDPSFEIGPSLNINLSGDDFYQGWVLRLPARSVYGFNSDGIDHIGWLFNPSLSWRHGDDTRLRFTYTGGLYYADREYHDYYYSVAPEFATPIRPAYAAKSGYSGFSHQFGLTRRIGDIWYGAYLRYDNLNKAEFNDSPLVETRDYFAAGIAVSWVFARSTRSASSPLE